MTIEEIKELLQIFNESGVAELELQRGENRLRLRRAGTSQEYIVTSSAPATMPAGSAAPTAYSQASAASGSGPSITGATVTPKAPEADSGHMLVKSPIVGT